MTYNQSSNLNDPEDQNKTIEQKNQDSVPTVPTVRRRGRPSKKTSSLPLEVDSSKPIQKRSRGRPSKKTEQPKSVPVEQVQQEESNLEILEILEIKETKEVPTEQQSEVSEESNLEIKETKEVPSEVPTEQQNEVSEEPESLEMKETEQLKKKESEEVPPEQEDEVPPDQQSEVSTEQQKQVLTERQNEVSEESSLRIVEILQSLEEPKISESFENVEGLVSPLVSVDEDEVDGLDLSSCELTTSDSPKPGDPGFELWDYVTEKRPDNTSQDAARYRFLLRWAEHAKAYNFRNPRYLLSILVGLDPEECIFQLEKGEKTGKLHYQIYIKLKQNKKVRAKTLARYLNSALYGVEVRIAINGALSKEYCMKKATRVEGPWGFPHPLSW
jgi:hypothetical protein